MSRVGKHPVLIPSGVDIQLEENSITVKGKLGKLSSHISSYVSIVKKDNQIAVSPKSSSKESRMMWGTTRNTINNMVTGVHVGFEKILEITGVGYRAAIQGKSLVLQLGFSHEVCFSVPDGIEIKCEKPTIISIKGANLQQIGQLASEIRSYRPPEPYKGKGVRYKNEYVFRKEGKKK